MFSITTMALSTNIPTPKASPPRDIMLMEIPLKYIKLNTTIIERGIDVQIIAETLRLFKNM
ncbi:hypothetical protein ES705_34772 [subsurface metagenome]